MLGADAGIVEARRDRVGVRDLTVLVREHRRPRSVEHARVARAEARGAGGLDADESHVVVGKEAGENADRVRAAAHARDDDLR